MCLSQKTRDSRTLGILCRSIEGLPMGQSLLSPHRGHNSRGRSNALKGLGSSTILAPYAKRGAGHGEHRAFS